MDKNSHGKVFGIREFAGIVNKAAYSKIKFNKELKLIHKNFESHIMLAVSEVNGCRICSYFHTKGALESGSTEEEISQLLGGNLSAVDKNEAVALIFGQHYADSSGDYDKEAFNRVIEAYGIDKAHGILAITRIITMGNAHGITIGYLKNRMSGKQNNNSKLFKELILILSPIVLLPYSLIKNLFIGKEKHLKFI